jgi:DNA helicase II / ATP-dependent DNA helicase PcrA
MTSPLEQALSDLSPIQRDAVNWESGAALVLAGPGSGKTRALTNRIARILAASPDKNFRILALTFTTKAATEMSERVERLVPAIIERTFIGTFHAFCTQLLRQHGSHVGIRPDFSIYDQDSDREELLRDALKEAAEKGASLTVESVRWLPLIDRLRSSLVLPEKVAERVHDRDTAVAVEPVYRVYEAALRARNVLDFNGLILEACRLMRDVPAVAARIRRTYSYWLLDEFQDTSPAQYKLIRLMSGDEFKNIFVVADDDQIIYQWAGASYRQIELFRNQYKPELIQLVENHRCPPDVVDAANLLVARNTRRTPNKNPLVSTRASTGQSVELRSFDTEEAERQELASEICNAGTNTWARTAILARNRQVLASMLDQLAKKGVAAILAQRRDRFVSAQFTWLEALLDQSLRPMDSIKFRVMVDAANRITEGDLESAILVAESEAAGRSYLQQWSLAAARSASPVMKQLASLADRLTQSRATWKAVVKDAIALLVKTDPAVDGIPSDTEEDRAAWDACAREIRTEKGGEPDLNEITQGMSLRSKEPPRKPNSVALMTVHAAKGLEFDFVYVIGMAESILPSWQSIQKGDGSAEMEEERRNCFVAITRTRERLILSRAQSYRGWKKEPSRFLKEMGFV